MSRRIIPTILGKGGDFQELGHHPLLGLLTVPRKDVLFIIGNWNAKVGSQVIPGVTGKFRQGVQNEAGEKLTEFCQENALVIANTVCQ